MSKEDLTFSSIGISRLRIINDAEGVTTLAAGHGCTFRCRYCINPQCFLKSRPHSVFTVKELIDTVRIDDLYFQATGGGVVFGGGEPLLQADFIHEFCASCPEEWRISLESSLAVPKQELEKVIGDIDFYLIDIKDMNPVIYRSYTGRDNTLVLGNLEFLASNGLQEKIRVRIPLIEGYNSREDVEKSKACLEKMGFRNFDLFRYNIVRAEEKTNSITGDKK